jgi:hypothetical protein
LQALADDGGAVEAQVAGRLQVATHLQDQVLDRGVGPLDRLGEARPIGPIDTVQALALGEVDPMVDRRGAHVELPGDIVVRAAAPDGLDHGSATGGFSISLLMVHPFQEFAFPTSLRRERSGCGGTWLFGMWWHLSNEI